MSHSVASETLKRVVDFYESLTPESLEKLSLIYHDDAQFIDPFNNVIGVTAINQVFVDMFESVQAPRFEVQTAFDTEQGANAAQSHQAFMTWDFQFHRNGQTADSAIVIHGSTYLVFGSDSRILIHRDYWDAAGQLYERIPVLGSILGMLRRKISSQPR